MTFSIHKWTVRSFMAIGALLGLTACSHTRNNVSPDPAAGVYGPPPGYYQRMQPIEDVYGPPIENISTDTLSQKVIETVQKQEKDN